MPLYLATKDLLSFQTIKLFNLYFNFDSIVCLDGFINNWAKYLPPPCISNQTHITYPPPNGEQQRLGTLVAFLSTHPLHEYSVLSSKNDNTSEFTV